MDWDHAIKRNSEVLAGIVETLFVMLGLVGEATVSRIPRPAYRAVLRVAPAVRLATAGERFTLSTSCSANATGWPSAPR